MKQYSYAYKCHFRISLSVVLDLQDEIYKLNICCKSNGTSFLKILPVALELWSWNKYSLKATKY